MERNFKKLNACYVCGSEKIKSLYKVTDRNQDVDGIWNIVACDACKLAWLEPFPTQDEINHFYKDVFYTNDGERFRSSIEALRRLLAILRSRHLRKLIPRSGRLLDFGSGAGHFGAAMKKFGWEVYNEDPYNKSYKNNSHISSEGEKLSVNFPDNYFDAVTLWYVIEHLPNPRKIIEEMNRILKPGGILLLAQQNFSSIQAKLLKSRWLILDPPRHIFQFSPANLLSLTKQIGFQKVCVKYASIELGPYTILQSLLNLILGNNNYLFKFLKNPVLRKSKSKLLMINVYISILLSFILAPLSFILYFILLLFNSGDIFSLYLKKI